VNASVVRNEVQHAEELATIDDTSDEEEETVILHTSPAVGPLLQFPTDNEYLAGYIWGMDLVFNVKTSNIRDVQNVETNLRVLTTKCVAAMYK